ncbi:glutamine--fructose-6-phosphate transaminase (isomerizing) [bacterium]|jgi:glutamine---fructose-6-phosphate transaminase (isomerizing)|nr:glutamine--fructose-6-phosphate transaminase (isomerizing) [bacterium]MBT4335618.1 glutamine--fructose-6-phosphate transaminase (isomerizing) [bacterium]MBT4495190.1 glutamine--fructose-6-phosphate transaminase (isomerizing) [bacterium]MBT4763687.1 glutamine--fructose-6-phosphate transaminase (isomerizing) [bacterium]MBT5401058.1 glutamine--fructose-6-phosphate transaminase (isomerizing) [bacterium]
MCGIIGYIGEKKALPIILKSLKKMEYRGYDSAGVALVENDKLIIKKKSGKLDILKKELKDFKNNSTIGIGHIRWATHGEPSDLNAHPHNDCNSELTIVHNGIIENSNELKKSLIKKGHIFKTETDSEVLAHLIEEYYKNNKLEEAVKIALEKVNGAYGIVVFSLKEEKLVAARLGSPVVLGIKNKEYFVASDVAALLPFTKEVLFLEEGEIAILDRQGYKIIKLTGGESIRETQTVDWSLDEVEKDGYDHFMLKEIMEEADTVRASMRGRVILEEGDIRFGGLIDVMDKLKEIDRIIIVACGTAHYAGRIAEYVIESLVNLPVEVQYASEFRYREEPLDKKSLVLAISQSGETADTLAAIRKAKENNVLTFGIVNVVGSTIARETDAGIYNHIGPEISVASTKAFVSQLVIIYLLAILLGRQRKLSRQQAIEILDELNKLPEKIETITAQASKIDEIAKKYYEANNFIYIGRKLNYPIALEGALKLKEISYIHAEGYPAGELKHGPLALIEEGYPVVAIIPQDKVYKKTINNLEEVKARLGKVIAITNEEDDLIKKVTDDVIIIPKTLEILNPILTVIPIQLLAYFIAKRRGCPIDQPRNLAKSVTVE